MCLPSKINRIQFVFTRSAVRISLLQQLEVHVSMNSATYSRMCPVPVFSSGCGLGGGFGMWDSDILSPTSFFSLPSSDGEADVAVYLPVCGQVVQRDHRAGGEGRQPSSEHLLLH